MTRNLCRSISPGIQTDSIMNMKARNSRAMTAKMLLVIVVVFAVCWLPTHCVQISLDTGTWKFNNATFIVKVFAHVLSFCNSAANPFIYAFMTKSFRESVRDVFQHKHKSNRVFVIIEND